jgi:hypothetical protein
MQPPLGSNPKAAGPLRVREIGWQGRQTLRDEKHPTGVCKVYHEVALFVKLLKIFVFAFIPRL